MKTLGPTLLSSKNFSASNFISLHHPDASFADLRRGIDHLRHGVEERGEEVRILVEREFPRFVSVKGTNDAVINDMKVEFLAEGTDHGTREVREAVKVTSHKAETIYLPLLANSMRAQKLRSTLGVFERSQWLFSLPRSLRTMVKAGNYASALREYHKAIHLLKTRPNQLLPISLTGQGNVKGNVESSVDGHSQQPAALNEAQIAARKAQQQRILTKIFDEVEKVMKEMKTELENTLTSDISAEKSVEEVEKCIE